MNRRANQWIRIGLWIIVTLFFVASTTAAYAIHEALQPSSGFMCGNSITGPVFIMLNFGVPVITVTMSGLGFLTLKAGGRIWPVASAGILSAATVAGFVLFGLWFYQTALPGHRLSNSVWWMLWG